MLDKPPSAAPESQGQTTALEIGILTLGKPTLSMALASLLLQEPRNLRVHIVDTAERPLIHHEDFSSAMRLAFDRGIACTYEHRRERMLIVGHQVTVNCMRYLLERMTEAQILDIDRRADVANCSVTSYAFDSAAGRSGKLVLVLDNFVAPLTEAGAAVTRAASA